jgi:hypothetical protein
MKISNERGSLNVLLIPFILVFLLMVAAAGFGAWAYIGRQDYKNNTDKKVAVAVDVAKKQEASVKDNEFIEKEKQPLKSYSGPAAYGSVVIKYPKTWGAYVVENQGSTPVDAYFHPNFVPATNTQTAFALRLQISSVAYDQELQQFDSSVKAGKVSVAPIKLPMVPSVSGVRIDGAITPLKSGSMVLLPLRDKTLKVWIESTQFSDDFNNNVLPNLVFSP